MFSNISWTNYLAAIGLLLTVYYLVIGIYYYSGDLQKLISGKKKKAAFVSPIHLTDIPDSDNIPSNEDIEQPQENLNTEVDDTLQEIDQLIEAVKDLIIETNPSEDNKEEFLLSLQILFEEHPNLKKSPQQSAINKLIVSECEKNGAIRLSEGDIVKLWKGQP